MLHEPVSSSRN